MVALISRKGRDGVVVESFGGEIPDAGRGVRGKYKEAKDGRRKVRGERAGRGLFRSEQITPN